MTYKWRVKYLEQLALLWGDVELTERLAEQPTTLLVLDVCSNFPDLLLGPKTIQKVILGLEINSHHHQDLTCAWTKDIHREWNITSHTKCIREGRDLWHYSLVICLLVLEAKYNHCQRHGAVEGVKSCFILNDSCPSINGEILDLQVQAQSVHQLTTLCLKSGLQKWTPNTQQKWEIGDSKQH